MKNEELRMMNSAHRSQGRFGFLHSSFFILHFGKALARYVLILLVRLYQFTLSPAKTFLFGPLAHCRFTPGCSEYALGALQTHGAVTGTWLATKRICRCHPWGECGHDPVPEKSEIGNRKSEIVLAPS